MASRGKVNTCEEMEEFTANCKLYGNRSECLHKNKLVDYCIKDKKYCPRVAKLQRKQEDQPEWKKDYTVFKKEHDLFFQSVIMSESFLKPFELQYPIIDVKATLEEESKWWSSDASGKGWDNKRKRSETKAVDWEETYKFALRRAIHNKQAFYKPKTNNVSW